MMNRNISLALNDKLREGMSEAMLVLGYSNQSEFIRSLIREKLIQLKIMKEGED